jgi:DNA-binding transcriptional MerR regulator
VHNGAVQAKRGCHKIATVSRLTGFSPELLRAWESRHRLLAPARGPGGQRLYSDDDVRLLRAVRTLLESGASIGEIAALGRRQLLATDEAAGARVPATAPPATLSAGTAPPPGMTPGVATATAPNALRERDAARALELGAQAIARLSARLQPDELLDQIVDTLASDFSAALARIWVYEPDENVLLLRASAGLSKRTTASPRARIDLMHYRYKVGVVARSKTPFVSNAIVGDREFDQRWVRRERLASVAIVPLTVEGNLQGVLALFFRVALSEQVVAALEPFATIAAASIAAHRQPPAATKLCA